jgi:hypothetical protein
MRKLLRIYFPLTAVILTILVLYGKKRELVESSLLDLPWGVASDEAPPTSVAPSNSLGAFIYSPNIASAGCLVPGASCTPTPPVATVVKKKGRHPPAVFIPVNDLRKLELLNRESKLKIKVERTGEQLGALRRKLANMVATNVLLRKKVRVLRKQVGDPGKPGYPGVSGRPGVSEVVGPGAIPAPAVFPIPVVIPTILCKPLRTARWAPFER